MEALHTLTVASCNQSPIYTELYMGDCAIWRNLLHTLLMTPTPLETVAKVNSLTILLARLSRLCRKDEAQGAEGEV